VTALVGALSAAALIRQSDFEAAGAGVAVPEQLTPASVAGRQVAPSAPTA
jgi:hypothetical protein